jgi:lysophospholipase L1-like esterase
MRARIFAATAVLTCFAASLPAAAQSRAPAPAPLQLNVPDASPGNGPIRIEWEVRNRFRLFRNEADFRRHVAAYRGDGVLAAEQRLAHATDGRGWARDMVDNLCVDQTGRMPETCLRDGQKENYLSPHDHAITAMAAGAVPPGALCAWSFDDGESEPGQATTRCDDPVRIRVRHGLTTIATVDVGLPDGTAQRVVADITVRDFLIAGMGDSVAAGEGNPDRAIALDDSGFCFRRFLAGSTSEYFRPGRAGFKGNKACDPALSTGGGNTSADWAKLNARWWSAACHRSLYGYQLRAALALAIENPQVAVTFLPLACSGSTIDSGFFGSLRARECPSTGSCTSNNVAQMVRLREAIDLARKTDKERKLDAILLTIGANDIWFSGLVADVITESATERALFKRGGLIADVSDARGYLKQFPRDFAKLRGALKPYLDGNLQRVIYVTYGNPAMVNGGQVCAGGRAGFDVHPAFNVDAARLRETSDFVENEFLPRLRALATCEASGACADAQRDRMTFVDQHQAEFAHHGFCARAPNDPPFDRECFLENGESFESNPSQAATDPMRCSMRARDFRPYSSRARWIRTANDSYFTAMTFPEGINTALQPSDLHDATWGATSAVYGGAVHPTAEGHAAMADAAMPALRAVLGLQTPQQVRSEPLAPLQLPPAATR